MTSKSKSGRLCIGPCYEKGEYILHPITMTYTTNFDGNFCPTTERVKKSKDKKLYINTDICDHPLDKTQVGIFIPTLGIGYNDFLEDFYNIGSFEEAVLWVNTNVSKPIDTKLRIIDCALAMWGGSSNFIVTQGLINFFIDTIKKYWMKDLYKAVGHYVKIDNGKISMEKTNSSGSYNEARVQKINFLIKKFVNKDNVYKVLTRYINDNKDRWDDIKSHTESIKRAFIRSITS